MVFAICASINPVRIKLRFEAKNDSSVRHTRTILKSKYTHVSCHRTDHIDMK